MRIYSHLRLHAQRIAVLASGRLAKGAMGTLGMRLASVGFAFVTSILLARLLGAHGLGQYAFALASIEILLVPAMLGIPSLLGREIPAGLHQRGPSYVRDITQKALRLMLLSGAIFSTFVALAAWLFSDKLEPGMSNPLIAAACMLPALTLLWSLEIMVRSVGHVIKAQIPLHLVRPSLILLAVVGMLWSSSRFSAVDAVIVTVVATFLAASVSFTFWRRFRPANPHPDPSQAISWKTLLKAGIPFTMIAGLVAIQAQADIILLGLISGAEDAGIYRVAHRLASVSAFPHMAFAAPLAPEIARLYAEGAIPVLKAKLQKVLLVTFSGALLIAALLIAAAAPLLGLFGSEFVQADTTLLILALTQTLLVIIYTTQALLSLTGHEKLVARNLIFSVLANIALNFLLIPSYGPEGAASATLIASLFFGILLLRQTKVSLGFIPRVFPLRR